MNYNRLLRFIDVINFELNVKMYQFHHMFLRFIKYLLGIQSVLWINDSHNQISLIFSRDWRMAKKVENSINSNVQFSAIGCRKPQGTH